MQSLQTVKFNALQTISKYDPPEKIPSVSFPSKYSLSLVAKLSISHIMLVFYFLSNAWMVGNDTGGNLAPRLALQERLSAMQIPAAFST